MSRRLLITVGTSLLTNRDRPWAGWNPRDKKPLPEQKVVEAWLMTASECQISAETNTLRSIGLEESDHLVFLHSETTEGQFCAQQLAAYYLARQLCKQAELRQIGSLGYEQESFINRGLKSLISVVIQEVRKAREGHQIPLFCATGGFKAEIAFLNVLGALLKIEVYYMRELFREVVRLPQLPLSWDVEYVLKHRDFFDWIDAQPRRSDDVENWLRARPELRSLVEEDHEGHTYLNAAGDLLYQAALQVTQNRPRAMWPPPHSRPPHEKNAVSTVPHHRPQGWEQIVTRLCAIDCVELVRYDDKARCSAGIKIIDSKNGVIGVCYSRGDQQLPLVIDTTARGEEQTLLVSEYIRRLVRH
ncbi:MAG: hypothetical protein KatS3mg113_0302 [Planctomycetaceae bacterium]|nr:MAG: hypothetical protein KatS3mg113_0302 [Planctomycetaceae bacterium]